MSQYNFTSLRPEYERLWAAMRVIKTGAAAQQAKKVMDGKPRYLAVERATGVPWFVVGCLHMRESSGNFNTYLGNGQALNRRTTIVPKGRGPFASFEAGAEDALAIDGLNRITNWDAARVAYAMESFNGFGYRHPARNIPSPYLWGGTSIQKSGKFVRDRVYDRTVMDPQLGGMAVLKTVMALDPSARFTAVSPQSPDLAPEKTDQDIPVSPKADDTEDQIKPLGKSKTIWGGLLQWFTGAGATLLAALSSVPWQVVAILAVMLLIGLYLVIKGRIDVQKIVQHLSQDSTPEEPSP